MSQHSEKALLGLDNTGSYWIIHYQTDSAASTLILNKTEPSISVEELLGTQSEVLQSEKLQELEARSFEKSWYIEDIQAFEAGCGFACARKLRDSRPHGSKLSRRDWTVEDIDLNKGLLDRTSKASSQAKAGSMSKRPRDSSPEPQPWSKRRPLDKEASYYAHADTYRPSYGPRATDDMSPSARTRHDSSFSTSSSTRGQEAHDVVGKSKVNDRLEQHRRPMQQLRQMHASATDGPWNKQHENTNAASRRPSGEDRYQSSADSTSVTFDFAGVPRGPKHNPRPRPSQSPFIQQRRYHEALDENHPDVIRQEDLMKLREKPHIFVSSSHLPFLPSTIPHLQRLVGKEFPDVSVKADLNGYYLVFPAHKGARKELRQCFDKFDKKLLFGEYRLHMEARVHEDTTMQRPPADTNGKTSQKTGEPVSRLESRVDRPITPVDGPAVSHLRPKADDEISMSSAAAPSEISSGATRAKTHCAECKNSHFPPYNQKFGCSTCPRHYHLMCRKPQLKTNEDSATWQCNYCIKKNRPRPVLTQRTIQAEPEHSKPDSSSLQELVQVANQHRQYNEQVLGALNWKGQELQSEISEPLLAKDIRPQSMILDPRLRGRAATSDPRLQDKVANGSATPPPRSHKHSSEMRQANGQQSVAHDSSAQPPWVNDVLRELSSRSVSQKEPSASGQERVKQVSVPDIQSSAQKADLDRALNTQSEHAHVGQMTEKEFRSEPLLHNEGQQVDLEPEVPDFSLEIPEAPIREISRSIDRRDRVIQRFDEEAFGSRALQVRSENQLSQNNLQSEKHNSLVRCSTCGKNIFSKSAKTDDPTCASCKNKKQTVQGNSAPAPLVAETAEEVWRRRLRPTQHQVNSKNNAGPDIEQACQGSHADMGTHATEAQVASAKDNTSEDADALSSEPCETAGGSTQMILREESVEAADESGQAAVNGGPSFEASRLLRRARSPANKNINNATVAMGFDNARSAIGSRAAKNTHGQADNDARPGEAVKDSAPCAKLPGHFSWPELIGFALAEASDHRMTAAQVHEWITDNVEGFDIHNTTHRSSIAATLSQQKAKFPKDDAVTEGSRQLSRWKLAPGLVSTCKNDLKRNRELLLEERALQRARSGLSRRKELNDPAKSPSASNPRPVMQQKDAPRIAPPSNETPMFIQRHRVAYDDDGRDIVAGFKDIPIERWTELAEVESLRAKGMRLYVGDYIKAPLPNRFKFADYTHKPLVQTIAQIEEIRQRRDEPGYAVLVQWFITKEAAEWWKCRHVKSLWPKDEDSGIYVPATVWDVLTSDFVIEQERLDPEETKRQIIPHLFFELDTEVWLLYLKEGRRPAVGPGIAFGPRSPTPTGPEAEDTGAGLERVGERSRSASSTSVPSQEQNTTQSPVALTTNSPVEANQLSKQSPPAKASKLPNFFVARESAPISERYRPTLMVEARPVSPGKDSLQKLPLKRQLFTPTPADDATVTEPDTTKLSRPRSTSNTSRRAPTSAADSPVKRQNVRVTPDEQAAVRAFLLNEHANAEYKVKNVFDASPERNPEKSSWDREAKIAEIKARPSRKARFTENLAYARLERLPNALYVEVNRPLPKAYKAPSSNYRPSSGYGNPGILTEAARTNGYHSPREEMSDADTDMPDADTQVTDSASMMNGTSEFTDPSKPEMFDTLEELLDLPTNLMPTLYEGKLAFRDGASGLDGRLPRAKKIFKVGRNVPGELK